jgi:hypothetical protein
MLGLASHPFFHALYVDDGCTTQVLSNGVLQVNRLTYVIENHRATHLGENSYHIPGMVGASVHFLGPEDEFDLTGAYELSSHPAPFSIQLHDISPNPFRDHTTIRFEVPTPGNGRVQLYDLSGKERETLLKGWVGEGSYVLRWAPKRRVAGVYVLVLQVGSDGQREKLIYIP